MSKPTRADEAKRKAEEAKEPWEIERKSLGVWQDELLEYLAAERVLANAIDDIVALRADLISRLLSGSKIEYGVLTAEVWQLTEVHRSRTQEELALAGISPALLEVPAEPGKAYRLFVKPDSHPVRPKKTQFIYGGYLK